MELSIGRVTTELTSAKNMVMEFGSSMWATAPMIVLGLGALLFLFLVVTLVRRSSRNAQMEALRGTASELNKSLEAARSANASARQAHEKMLEAERGNVRDLTAQLEAANQGLRDGQAALSALQATHQQESEAARVKDEERKQKHHEAINVLNAAIDDLGRSGGIGAGSLKIGEAVTIIGRIP